jgi:phosphate transport system substrate-binding protein
MFKNFIFLLLIIITINLTAKDNIKIVGSSTVYPFSSAVAEELGATTDYPTPTVESTGSGGGMKLFCAGNNKNAPDITNSSRKMKKKELELCHKNGVKNITEAIIGYDGIVFAQRKKNKPFTITTKQLLLAVAKEVPNKKGDKLIANPYKKWSDIDISLPKRKIIIYGPPKSSGTRDAFEDMILKHQTKHIKAYTDIYKKTGNKTYKKYKLIRTDGIYIPSGENDNLIVAKLDKNKHAFGIFGYSFLIENDDKVQSAKINGIYPTPNTISNGKYPISRSLFFYIKNHNSKKSKAINKYVEMFMSEDMIGEDSILGEVGLISLPSDKRAKIRESVNKKVRLTLKSYL